MMNFIVLTLSITVAMLLTIVIYTVAVFALMGNAKFMAWVLKCYTKMLEKSLNNYDTEIGA